MVHISKDELLANDVKCYGKCISMRDLANIYYHNTEDHVHLLLQKTVVRINRGIIATLQEVSCHMIDGDCNEYSAKKSLKLYKEVVVFASKDSVFIVRESDGETVKLTSTLIQIILSICDRKDYVN